MYPAVIFEKKIKRSPWPITAISLFQGSTISAQEVG